MRPFLRVVELTMVMLGALPPFYWLVKLYLEWVRQWLLWFGFSQHAAIGLMFLTAVLLGVGAVFILMWMSLETSVFWRIGQYIRHGRVFGEIEGSWPHWRWADE